MKGCMFKASPKHRQHLVDDYRDPELPPLPPVLPYELRRGECSSIGSLSMRNVLSDPWLIDHLDQVGLTNEKRVIHDVEYIKTKKEAILRRAHDIQERKNRRLQQRDIEQAMKSLEIEGYKLTHAVMLMFLDRDAAMLQALKNVQTSNFTTRGTLRTNKNGRLVMSSLKQWEHALKEKDKGKAASTLLYLSLYFQNKEDPTYYWLIYEVYHLAIKSCRGCKGNITEAVIRYLFGKFLLEKAKHFKEAEFHLERACSLSYGYNWTTAFVIKEENDHIHDSSNYLLHILLIKRAADCSYKHPLKAIKLVRKAVRVISRANNEGALADAHYDLAVMYNRAHLPERAVLTLEKALELFEKIEDHKNICLVFLLKSHCLRRMQDYKEAFKSLKTVVSRAQDYNLPSLEAKGYKHMAEYFLGKNQYQSANVYLKKSYDLFEKCDLKDELDEVSILFSYTKAWLRKHDVYYILFNIMSREEENIFDYPVFVELGVPFYNRFSRLKFVYKMKDRYKFESGAKQNELPASQEVENATDNGENSPEPQETPPEKYCSEDNLQIRSDQERDQYDVPEYFAFSDLTGWIFDEELEQATALFSHVNIDLESEIALQTLRNVPMQHRETKKSIANLVAIEISAAQKLNCLKHRMYELSILSDKTQVERKMLLMNQQLQENLEDDYEKQNEYELWKMTVEIHPFEPMDVYTKWKNKALEISQKLEYSYDGKPESYRKLLKALLPLIRIYECYDYLLLTQGKQAEELEEMEEHSDQELTAVKSTNKDIALGFPDSVLKEVEVENAKQTKICRCKEPRSNK